MIISTNNDPHGGGRRIERARRQLSKGSFGYTNHAATGPALQAVLTGSDGKSYTVIITKEDIAALDAARKQWVGEFDKALTPLFTAATPHPGDTITLHLARGDTGTLQVDVFRCLGVPIIVPAGEALSIANDGLAITIAREAK